MDMTKIDEIIFRKTQEAAYEEWCEQSFEGYNDEYDEWDER